ncbi:hypothetical protein TPHA_0D04050 [Tetrapisispora phaffii CBS 4417]|uniref:Cyclin N-terminal domain-containing protein n=1 Tax=Tetrapisispora phaffii (strain ATCC 24235 / CBS 4417 / NBRC 1672 / NRRL Y-8282 / UCD 70-5) TaxID=1071381 RepID=G8BT67_TETPH|nr:hypothetical protein TPHA_0D04050 [Tetrapisispora phaffii CBS 4417]CCE63038.1 hypothetical protein TPHA_0D04050 [Tetrapisispora phaffii CBS 4417]
MENIEIIITSPESENSKVRLAQPASFKSSNDDFSATVRQCKENIIKNNLTASLATKKRNYIHKTTHAATFTKDKKSSNAIETEITKRESLLRSIKNKDITLVNEYSDDIFEYLYQHELNNLPTHNYSLAPDSQYYMRPAMRAILVDWLVEVHNRFEYTTETLLLAINLFDRFLSQNKVTMSKLQLLAITSLFVAAKFEEVNLPKVVNYSYLTDGAATEEDIITAEKFMIQSLRFNISSPSPVSFMKRISNSDDLTDPSNMDSISQFLIEYTTCSSKFIDLKPSLASSMSMYIARKINLQHSVWDDQIKKLSGNIDAMNDKQFQNLCKELIMEIVTPSTKLTALTNKFQTSTYNEAYKKIENWCQHQISKDFAKLF